MKQLEGTYFLLRQEIALHGLTKEYNLHYSYLINCIFCEYKNVLAFLSIDKENFAPNKILGEPPLTVHCIGQQVDASTSQE